MPEPTFSIVIPTYNYGHMIEDALQSVIAQKRDDVEILVIDDASTDDTPEVVSRYRKHVTYVRLEENVGPALAWQSGLEKASGEFVCKLDADDWQLPGYMDTVEAAFRSSDHVGMVAGSVLTAREGEDVVRPKPILAPAGMLEPDVFRRHLLDRFFFRMPGVTARREALVDHLPIRVDLRMPHDWEFLLRAMRGWSCWVLRQPLAVYRIHGESLTRTGTRDSRLRRDMETLMAAAQNRHDPSYLDPEERREFARGVAVTYLSITGRTMTARNLALALSELRFAIRLAGQEGVVNAASAALQAVGLTVQHGIRAVVDSRRSESIPLASVLPGGLAWHADGANSVRT